MGTCSKQVRERHVCVDVVCQGARELVGHLGVEVNTLEDMSYLLIAEPT